MTDRDAYRDDMSFLRPLDIDDPDLAPLVEEIRTLFRRSPAPAVEARHVSAIVELAQAAPAVPSPEREPGGRPLRTIARLGLVAAAFGLLTGGLAVAGVDIPILPDRASDKAEEAVAKGDRDEGEDATGPTVDQLPEKASDNARDVITTIETNLPRLHNGELSGCQFGAMVSAAARDVEPDTSKCAEHDGDGGSKGSEASAKGKARAEEARAAGRARGEEASEGKANAGDKADKGATGSGTKSDAGAENSAAGKANAAEAKAAGQAKGEEASGGKANPGGNSPTD